METFIIYDDVKSVKVFLQMCFYPEQKNDSYEIKFSLQSDESDSLLETKPKSPVKSIEVIPSNYIDIK